MAIVIIRQDGKTQAWRQAILKEAPEIEVYDYHADHPRDKITMALVWKHPPGAIQGYPNLQCIACSGAGVDFIFDDAEAPTHLPITRVVDDQLAIDMSEHVIAVIFAYLKHLFQYKNDQANKIWQPRDYHRIADFKIGILGMGTLGTVLAQDLVRFGFQVQGWSNTPKELTNVRSFVGEADLDDFLAASEILVCLLPLTGDTRGILNKSLFARLPKGSFVINVARGPHVVDEDLIAMLDSGHLSGACLDVYHEEPLDRDHPFWEHPKVHMTPHYASVSDTDSVVPQIVENYRRLQAGEPLLHEVSKERGY